MSLVRRVPALMLVMACAGHAKQAARNATRGVKAEIALVDPAVARTVGAQAGRGVVAGALEELTSQQRALFGDVLEGTSHAAARGVAMALSSDSYRLQEMFDRAGASAVGGIGRGLAADTMWRDQLASMSHQLSASAVYGARDALADIFPECTGKADWRRCVEDGVGTMSRTAAREMMVGFMSAVKWPILAFVFLAGALVTLLFVRVTNGAARRHAREPHPHPPA